MKQEYYLLANRIASSGDFAAYAKEELDDRTRQKYRHDILLAIKKEKRKKREKRVAAAAAGIAVMAAVTGIFHNEVQAAMEQIHMQLGALLGLERDYAERYTRVVHTSVSSAGYIVTLDEVIASPRKLYMNFFIERSDGGQIDEFFSIRQQLSINGEDVNGGSGTSSSFVDSGKKILKVTAEYDLFQADSDKIDFSTENLYQLELIELAGESENAGCWEFKFLADSSDVCQDTKVMKLGSEYMMPDGTKLVLDELVLNKMEQQITYHLAGNRNYHEIKLQTVDDQGQTAEFAMGPFYEDNGYLRNSFILKNGEPIKSWIAEDAKELEVTAYVIDAPEIDGLNVDKYKKQIGETVFWDLTKLERMGKE